MEWLLGRGCGFTLTAILTAVRHGHVDIADLLWKRSGFYQSYYSTRVVKDSAHSGSLPMLQWAMDHVPHPTEDACKAAALNGHMKTLCSLRSHHCPWDGRTLRDAAFNGHLDILQWALANGCPWTAADRQNCLFLCPGHRPGMRRWIEECWPEKPREVKE